MATSDTPEAAVHKEAIAQVGRAVENDWGGITLRSGQFHGLPKGPWAAGWRFRIDVLGEVKAVDLVVDEAFPWSAPRLYLRRPLPLGTLPHLEGDGYLCVFPSRTPADPGNPVGIVAAYLRGAVTLSRQWQNPDWVAQELASEFRSYIGIKPFRWRIRSLHSPSAYEAAEAFVWRSRGLILLGKTEEELRHWLSQSKTLTSRVPHFDPALVLSLPELPLLAKMPRTARDLYSLSESLGRENEFRDLMLGPSNNSVIAVILPTSPQSIMIAYEIPAPAMHNERRRRPVHAGFRTSIMSENIMLARRAGAGVRVFPQDVSRLDAAWVLGRDANLQAADLRNKRVAIIGCGSLGSGVAVLLAKAGVERFDLVDPEILESENVSRHELGMDAVGHWKAEALAERLKAGFPHISYAVGHSLGWRTLVRNEGDKIARADLVVLTVGSWADEGGFEQWRLRQLVSPPAVYGWLEPFAVAGHAVALDQDGPCFGCGLDRFGQSPLRVADWQEQTTIRFHPACGGAFQPYGAASLAHVQSLIADVSIDRLLGRVSHHHRIWSAPLRTLERDRGRWTDDWRAFAGLGVDHGGEYERSWSINPSCQICGQA